MSSLEDAKKFLQLIENCFVVQPAIRKFLKNWEALSKNVIFKLFKNSHKLTINQKDYVGNSETNISQIQNNYSTVKNQRKFFETLEKIFLYPIKSCGAFIVEDSWKLTNKGLKYDREWMIINSAGICVTQKHNKKLCLVKPYINLDKNTMRLEFKGNNFCII